MNPHARIDAPAGNRCRHDMLPGQCATCKGLPDVRPLDFGGRQLADDASIALRWLPTEMATECASCYRPIRRGEKVAYVRALDGNVGMCCEDVA